MRWRSGARILKAVRLVGESGDCVDEGADRVDGVREGRLLVVVERDLDDALDPAPADDGRSCAA